MAQPEPHAPLGLPGSDSILGTAEKEEVDLVATDIRYIKSTDDGRQTSEKPMYRRPFYWVLNALLFLMGATAALLSRPRSGFAASPQGSRRRRSHAAAKVRLRTAFKLAKESKTDEFYAEISRAVTNYFADKFNLPAQGLSLERVEESAAAHVTAEQLNKIRRLFHEMSMGRFSSAQMGREHMEELYDLADETITAFEKVKFK